MNDEYLFLKVLDHPNIVRLIEVFKDDENLFLVTELCKGIDMVTKINEKQKFEEKDAAYLLK